MTDNHSMEPSSAEAPRPKRRGFKCSILNIYLSTVMYLILSLHILTPLTTNSAQDHNNNLMMVFPTKNSTLGASLQLSHVKLSDTALANLLDLKANDPPPRQRKFGIRYNDGNHLGGYDLKKLHEIQQLVYETLSRWNELAKDLEIDRWVVHGGSAIGAKCFSGMNPWDDDVDLTVLHCGLLDTMWRIGEKNITKFYPGLDERSHSMDNVNALWEARLIKVRGQDVILSRGDRCCKWYKLMSMDLAFLWKPGDAIGGVELECMNRGSSMREKRTMKQSGWSTYLKGSKELFTVPFGPTTIKSMEPNILNRYIQLRYGKSSPCQYPFSNGEDVEKFPSVLASSNYGINPPNTTISSFRLDQDQARMDFVLNNWYIPKSRRNEWYKKRGDKNQMEYTRLLPNIDKVEIDNSISPHGCAWQSDAPSAPSIKVVGWNAERGTHWDKFYKLIQEKDELQKPMVILLNEMDIGMARSGNVHTVRRLALQLGMNYAYGIEFLELTRGTRKEQEATEDKPERGINADGFEVRLGGRMGLFARIFQSPSPLIPVMHNRTTAHELPNHFVVGNVHKLGENTNNREALWNYYGFGAPVDNSTIYAGKGLDLAPSQRGVIVQGDFGPQFCALGGLSKMNNYRIHKTFRVQCLQGGNVEIKPLSGDFFCSNMRATRDVKVTAPCDWSNAKNPLTMADHAIVSIEVASNK